MDDITVEGPTLVIGDERVEFEVPIADHIVYDDFAVVRLENAGERHPDSHRNVIAVDADGTIRWKIPEQPPSESRPYTNIYTEDGEDLWTNNASGYLFRVDPETGDLLDREFVK